MKKSLSNGLGLLAIVVFVFAPHTVVGQNTAATQFRARIDRMNQIYDSPQRFEQDEQLTRNVIGICNQVIDDPLFPALSGGERAEILHRGGYALVHYNDRWFLAKNQTLSGFGMRTYFTQLRVASIRVRQALELDTPGGRISEQRTRSLKLLFEISRKLVYQGIVFETEKPAVADLGLEMKQEGSKVLETALSFQPLTFKNPLRYLGDGLFLFFPEARHDIMYPLAGLLRYTKDIPAGISNEDAANIPGGVHYSVPEQVVPWANSLGESASKRERDFLQYLVHRGVLKYTAGVYTATGVTDFTLSMPSPQVWTHELAHIVRHRHPAYLNLARAEFAKLPPADQALFRKFMLGQNPDLPETEFFEEFYAYSHQLGDWRLAARRQSSSNLQIDNTRIWGSACVFYGEKCTLVYSVAKSKSASRA